MQLPVGAMSITWNIIPRLYQTFRRGVEEYLPPIYDLERNDYEV